MNPFLNVTEFAEPWAWPMLALGMLAVFSGSAVQGSTGIGLGMLAAPILMLINPVLVPAPLLVLALLVSLLIARREWRAIDRRRLAMAVAGRIPGSVLAGFTIALLPPSVFRLVFGLLILAAVVLSMTGLRLLPTAGNLFTAGLASGYMGTITSVGAPPIALAYQHGTPAEIRSTISAFFVAGSAISLAVLAWFGKFSWSEVIVSLVFLPALIAGFWFSGKVLHRISSRSARHAILLMSAASAAVLIAMALSSLV